MEELCDFGAVAHEKTQSPQMVGFHGLADIDEVAASLVPQNVVLGGVSVNEMAVAVEQMFVVIKLLF